MAALCGNMPLCDLCHWVQVSVPWALLILTHVQVELDQCSTQGHLSPRPDNLPCLVLLVYQDPTEVQIGRSHNFLLTEVLLTSLYKEFLFFFNRILLHIKGYWDKSQHLFQAIHVILPSTHQLFEWLRGNIYFQGRQNCSQLLLFIHSFIHSFSFEHSFYLFGMQSDGER